MVPYKAKRRGLIKNQSSHISINEGTNKEDCSVCKNSKPPNPIQWNSEDNGSSKKHEDRYYKKIGKKLVRSLVSIVNKAKGNGKKQSLANSQEQNDIKQIESQLDWFFVKNSLYGCFNRVFVYVDTISTISGT